MKSWWRSSAASSNASTSKIERPRPSTPSPSRKARTDPFVMASDGLVPVEHHLAGLAGLHGLEALAVVLVGHLVGDQRLQVETGLQQAQHLAPGGEHLAAIDALDGEGLEDDLAPVGLHRLG